MCAKKSTAAAGAVLVAGVLALIAIGSPALGFAVLLGGSSAAGLWMLRAKRRRSSHPAAGARPLNPAAVSPALDEELHTALARDVARAERYGDALTLVVVEVTAPGAEPLVSESVEAQVTSALDRVMRASDSSFQLADGRFAVILERCPATDATAFGGRLVIGANSRPLIVNGERVSFALKLSITEYNPHQFDSPRDFLGAAMAARPATTKRPSRRFVTDGHELRGRLYGKGDDDLRAA